MVITRTPRPETLELKLKGRMDAAWSEHVATALAECVRSGQHRIGLDMAEVDYISSAGIRILVLYARQLANIRGRLAVINASSIVRKVLGLAGLEALLLPTESAGAPASAEPSGTTLNLAEPGATAEIFELDANASLRVHWPGNSTEWLNKRGQPETCALNEFPAQAMGLGLGALASGETSIAQALGEFLAAGGAAVCQPADGFNKPDYLLSQGALTPTLKVAYGMLGYGGFRHLLRFEKSPQEPGVALSTVVKACIDSSNGSQAVGIAMVAETDSLVRACLRKGLASRPVAAASGSIFSFPEIRDWLSFASEAVFSNSTCLVVGFAAAHSRGPALLTVKPLIRSGELTGHFHAAALPYCPLRKGRIELGETVRLMFETGQVLGVLHLLNDWRELSGAGESRFVRGACWCAPLTF